MTTQVVIEVSDVNDNQPRLTQQSYTVRVPELMSPGSPVITVEATDDDIDDTLTFSISGSDAAHFYADSVSGVRAGVIRVKQASQK